MKSKLINLTKNYDSNKWQTVIEFEDSEIVNRYHDLRDKTINCEIKAFREKRSLDANAYYWVLTNKLAAKLHLKDAEMHNALLRSYGTIDTIDGKPITVTIPDSDEAERTAMMATTYHIKPTSQVREGKDGILYRTYVMIKGSHEYDSSEMSRLINGTVTECKEAGIETLSPDEIKRMLVSWNH